MEEDTEEEAERDEDGDGRPATVRMTGDIMRPTGGFVSPGGVGSSATTAWDPFWGALGGGEDEEAISFGKPDGAPVRVWWRRPIRPKGADLAWVPDAEQRRAACQAPQRARG